MAAGHHAARVKVQNAEDDGQGHFGGRENPPSFKQHVLCQKNQRSATKRNQNNFNSLTNTSMAHSLRQSKFDRPTEGLDFRRRFNWIIV